jgi:rare lipoprotein A
MVRVTNHRTHKTCVVRITDRGPYAHGRIIDLSKGAAQAIGMSGTAKVTLEIVDNNS